ncbi:hypothetical protein [uncultured Tenacibaculum sp.]|uniref:hypothetical protein n=1 Tax=uncultured Tenacibaculum sp. TaxID=174713 RepID=UPI00261B0DC7|nr:hypothetical protein [uncultured Tenacibaculum sp.]
MKKRKENIKKQILKKLEYYRKERGITFFDNPNHHFKENILLDDNELEVLSIKLNRSREILITTKYVYYINKNILTKILGKDIDRFDYMEFINGEEIIESKSKIKIMLFRFKIYFRIGNYRIVKKDGSFIELTIWKTQFADCLNECVKKLKFVGNKYEAI